MFIPACRRSSLIPKPTCPRWVTAARAAPCVSACALSSTASAWFPGQPPTSPGAGCPWPWAPRAEPRQPRPALMPLICFLISPCKSSPIEHVIPMDGTAKTAFQLLFLQHLSFEITERWSWLSVVHYLKCNFLVSIHAVISKLLYSLFNLCAFSGWKYN